MYSIISIFRKTKQNNVWYYSSKKVLLKKYFFSWQLTKAFIIITFVQNNK